MPYGKLSRAALALACLALVAGCKKDAQVDTTLAELDTFTQEIVKKIEAAPNSAGVDEAQKYLDSRKADIRAKVTELGTLRGFQVSEESKKKMLERFTENAMSVGKLKIKYMTTAMRDPNFNSKLDKLVSEYNATITPPTSGAK